LEDIMRDIKNYENLGSRKGQDSVEDFYRNKQTGHIWIRSYSLWANSSGEDWMPLDGNCEELLEKWKNKENMQEYATMNYLEKWTGKPSSSQKDFSFKGFEVIEKTVKPHATSAHVGVPVSWISCRVAVVRLTEGSEQSKSI
jgi:hypothetical protein